MRHLNRTKYLHSRGRTGFESASHIPHLALYSCHCRQGWAASSVPLERPQSLEMTVITRYHLNGLLAHCHSVYLNEANSSLERPGRQLLTPTVIIDEDTSRLYSCPKPTVSSTAQVSFCCKASKVLYGGRSNLLKQVCDFGS